MKKINIFLAFLILISIPLVSFADEIFLKNGDVVQCNVLEENKEQDSVKVDVIFDGQLVGMQIVFNSSEIKEIKRDGKYKDSTRIELTQSKKSKAVKEYLKRLDKRTRGIDKAIKERVSDEARRIEKIDARQEKQRQREKEMEYEKEKDRLKAERRLELLEEAKKKNIDPKVYIIDK